MSDLVQLTVAGVALGCVYALVCLGFVVIYKATGVINFAQGGFVVLGAFLTYQFADVAGVPFLLSIPLAMGVAALLAALVERLVLRRMVGQPVFAVIMITIGLLYLIEQGSTVVWGHDMLLLGDPWGIRTVAVGGAVLKLVDLWTIGSAAVVLGAFFLFFRYSALGVAMRATASDPEAALAHGISARTVYALAWAIAAAVAVVAGVMLASGARGVDVSLGLVALRAFPAMILGGLDSPHGAVAGGIIIGVTEVLTAGYVTPNAHWLGENFHTVMPYVVMILILVVRPYGLFGTPEVRRV